MAIPSRAMAQPQPIDVVLMAIRNASFSNSITKSLAYRAVEMSLGHTQGCERPASSDFNEMQRIMRCSPELASDVFPSLKQSNIFEMQDTLSWRTDCAARLASATASHTQMCTFSETSRLHCGETSIDRTPFTNGIHRSCKTIVCYAAMQSTASRLFRRIPCFAKVCSPPGTVMPLRSRGTQGDLYVTMRIPFCLRPMPRPSAPSAIVSIPLSARWS